MAPHGRIQFREIDTGTHNMVKAWEILEEAIPRGESEDVANFFGLSRQEINKWRRETEAEDKKSSGRRSPLDAVLMLINAVYARNPAGADLIVDRINSELQKLKTIHESASPVPLERIELRIRDIQRDLGAL